jgi:hypothetical protein
MKKSIVYPIIVAIFLGIGALLIKAFQLNFEGLFVDYTFEVFVLIIFLVIVIAVICWQTRLSFINSKNAEILQLKAENKNLEKLISFDGEAQSLRAFIQYKKDNNIS